MSMSNEMKASDIDGIERVEDITKSLYDKRSYRGVKLRNKLKALLISDPETDVSAASLVVGVGALNDFDDLPGVAHFVEHMLFVGSKKYPQENDYHKFVSDHGGKTNASTTKNRTKFYFKINPEALAPALDRFAQFFLEPLMDASAIDREVNAVNSEHEKNIPLDQRRILQVERSLCKENHPYNKFFTGNLVTLDTVPKCRGIDVRNKLLEFHSMWYSSNIMCLAVLGKESLDDLEKMIIPLFENIENKNVKKTIYEDHPYGPEQLKHKIYIVPVKDVRILKISFSTPDFHDLCAAAPDDYVSHLIGHEGPGSLLSVLRGRGLSNNLSAYSSGTVPGFKFFVISVDLTKKAMNRTDEIVTLVFQYIRLLEHEGIQEWIFRENKKLDEINFLFKDKGSPYGYVKKLASAMHAYPIKDVLSYDYLYDQWDPSIIKKFLCYLNPNNMNIIIVSQSFKKIADQVERWYGTKYKVETIPDDLINKWQTIELSPDLKLPSPNEFVPENFSLYPQGENEPKNPYVIHESSLSRIWFKQDDEVNLPKLEVCLEVFSPIASVDAYSQCNLYMMMFLLDDALKEYTRAAALAGLGWGISAMKFGLEIYLCGYNEKLPILLEKIMSKMTNFQVDGKRLEIFKERYIRSLKNFKMQQPHQQADFFLKYVMFESARTNEELLNAAKIIQKDNLAKFVSEVFSRVFVQGLIHGNCDKQKAAEIVNIIETPFKLANGILLQQLLPSREVKIDDGRNFTYEVFNKYHRSSCCFVYFQCNSRSIQNNSLIELFAQIVEEPCSNILRTKEKLGSIVRSTIWRTSGVQGFVILVQSKKHPAYVNSRVEEFLRSVYEMLKNMSVQEFETHKTALATKNLERPKELGTRTGEYWVEIINRRYNFDRINLEVQHLQSLKKTDVLKFFEEMLHESSSKRRKLSIHVISELENPTLPNDMPNEGSKIEDITIFKSGSSLIPLPSYYSHDGRCIEVAPIETRLES